MANPITPTIAEKIVTTDTSASSLVVGGATPVATTGTGGINAGPILGNTSVSDSVGSMATIRAGGIGIASQAALDFVFASSATQLARLAKGTALQGLRINAAANAYEFASDTFTLLHAASGTGAVASATNISTYAVSGLTAKDRLLVLVTLSNATGDAGTTVLYNSTDSVQIAPLVAVNTTFNSSIKILSIDGSTLISVTSVGLDGNAAAAGMATFTQNWTGSWTMALRTGTIASGDLDWSFMIIKLAGQ